MFIQVNSVSSSTVIIIIHISSACYISNLNLCSRIRANQKVHVSNFHTLEVLKNCNFTYELKTAIEFDFIENVLHKNGNLFSNGYAYFFSVVFFAVIHASLSLMLIYCRYKSLVPNLISLQMSYCT